MYLKEMPIVQLNPIDDLQSTTEDHHSALNAGLENVMVFLSHFAPIGRWRSDGYV
jgi:hypothetical protein